VWAELAEEIRVELLQLCRLLSEHERLLAQPEARMGDPEAALVVAAILHSFYTGVEGIFSRVAKRIDGHMPSGEAWHRDILDAMARPTAGRPALISSPLRDSLEDYLRFRHFFRHAYSFVIEMSEVAPLARKCSWCLTQLDRELGDFLNRLPPEKGN